MYLTFHSLMYYVQSVEAYILSNMTEKKCKHKWIYWKVDSKMPWAPKEAYFFCEFCGQMKNVKLIELEEEFKIETFK